MTHRRSRFLASAAAISALCVASIAQSSLPQDASRLVGSPRSNASQLQHVSREAHIRRHVYYVNCRNRASRRNGHRDAPWRTPRPLIRHTFEPGSVIKFARGCEWQGSFDVPSSGTRNAPITLGAYGRGRRPTFRDWSGDATAVVTLSGNYVHVENIRVRGARRYGIQAAGSFDAIRRSVVSHAGNGVLASGLHTLISGVRVRDLHMILNTPGGDNDYGAVGYVVMARHAIVENSSCRNCIAKSYDYGHDGGFVEIYNEGDSLLVRDNVAVNTQGFMEVGAGSAGKHANDVTILRNSMIDVHGGFWIHAHDRFGISTSRILIAHNSIEDTNDSGHGYVLGGCLRAVHFEYNFVKTDLDVAAKPPRTHRHNRYDLLDGAKIGF